MFCQQFFQTSLNFSLILRFCRSARSKKESRSTASALTVLREMLFSNRKNYPFRSRFSSEAGDIYVNPSMSIFRSARPVAFILRPECGLHARRLCAARMLPARVYPRVRSPAPYALRDPQPPSGTGRSASAWHPIAFNRCPRPACPGSVPPP